MMHKVMASRSTNSGRLEIKKGYVVSLLQVNLLSAQIFAAALGWFKQCRADLMYLFALFVRRLARGGSGPVVLAIPRLQVPDPTTQFADVVENPKVAWRVFVVLCLCDRCHRSVDECRYPRRAIEVMALIVGSLGEGSVSVGARFGNPVRRVRTPEPDPALGAAPRATIAAPRRSRARFGARGGAACRARSVRVCPSEPWACGGCCREA